MRGIRNKVIQLSLVLGVIFAFAEGITYGGDIMDSKRGDLAGVKMSYRLEGAYCPYKYIQIEISGTGEGKLSYELYREYVEAGQEKDNTVTLKVDERLIKELVDLYQAVDFFNLEVIDLNKERIRVTDVGTTTLTFSYAGKERSLSYGYVENDPFKELVKLYWEVAEKYLPNLEMRRKQN